MENRAFYRDERGKGSLARYLRDIAHSEPLSHREEAELARQIRAGSQEARDKLVMANHFRKVKLNILNKNKIQKIIWGILRAFLRRTHPLARLKWPLRP
ncbi:MAG: hypothetical protein EXS64_16530 [Candidatus Latescibacteria bacterium]|nr:hypothetical protein [Candidatus Latescibacterota bacterium]